ncbi:MAG: hypothetical protein JKY34_11915 [Kordiimonadaceae bacterium]|nr:hypothetical protein [Kordiimonadaceae bacterium]
MSDDSEIWRQLNDLKDKVHETDKGQAVNAATLSEIRREMTELKDDSKAKFKEILAAITSTNKPKPVDWARASKWVGAVIIALVGIISTLVKREGGV